MAVGILNRLRRRQSTSPHRAQAPHAYVHHASDPPEWSTSPAQVTPDVYITSPPEEDGLLTSVCVHRALEHEPKRLRKDGKHEERVPSSPPASAIPLADVYEPAVESPPAFRRPSLQAPEVVLPKKPSEILRESTAKWRALNKASTSDKDVVNQGEALTGADVPTHELVRVSSGRGDGPATKSKSTLRHRASKVIKSLTNREGGHLSTAEKRISLPDARRTATWSHKRRNTLSDGSEAAFNMLAQTATAHGIPGDTGAETCAPARTSVEGRRRSSTLGHVGFMPRAVNGQIVVLEPAAEILATAPEHRLVSPQNLQRKRNKNAFTNLFNLKSDKLFRSPPPAKPSDEPTIPGDLAKAAVDPGTPASQTSFASATPKSKRSRRFGRHRRSGTRGSISRVSTDVTGTPSTPRRAETQKTPTSPRSSPFSIVDLRKGFGVRGLGKNKGKLFSAKASTGIGSPPPPVTVLPTPENHEPLETVTQRYKMSRPPPLQPTEPPAPLNEDAETSPTTVDFVEPLDAGRVSLPSPTESDGPTTPMFGAHDDLTSTPTIQLDEPKVSVDVPELSHTPPTSDENDQTPERPSMASEATVLAEDPLFGSLNSPSTIPDLQLREPSTKTSTLDAHLRLDSLRFDDFSFDARVF